MMSRNNGVRKERTGWRDERISKRHRKWGFNCPAVDLDFLMVEYNHGLPVAIVEYKHHCARMPNTRHPTYRALRDLADNYAGHGLPFIVAFYWPDIWAFRVKAINESALKWFDKDAHMTEREYVTRLYDIRELTCNEQTKNNLNTSLPDGLKGDTIDLPF